MLPYIVILGIKFPTYSLMIGVGALAFLIYYLSFVVKKEKIDRITSNRIVFSGVLGFAVLGVSAFIFNAIFHSIEEGEIVVGGITWLGGVIGLIPAMLYLLHYFVPKERGNEINRLSTLLPGVVIAHAFGRLGCFFGGCCYGGPTDSWLGVVFPAGSSAGYAYPDINSTPHTIGEGDAIKTIYQSVPVLPTQLIEALFEIILFIVMIAFYKKFKHHNIEIYCFVYGTFRFILEFWRGDDRGNTGFVLSPSQLMSIILFIFATLLILFRRGIIFKNLAKKCEAWREVAKTAPAGGTSPFMNNSQRATNTIKELHKLKEDGIITDEEFEEKKKEILKRI